MSHGPSIWKGVMLDSAKRVFESDPSRGVDVARRIGIDRRHLYRLAKRNNWKRPAEAQTKRVSA